MNDVWCLTTEMTPYTSLNIAPCLRARDYKDPPCVLAMIPSGVQMDWNDSGIMSTLRADAEDNQVSAVIIKEIDNESTCDS